LGDDDPGIDDDGRATAASSRSDRIGMPYRLAADPSSPDASPALSCPALPCPVPSALANLAFDNGRRRRRTLRSGLATSGSTHMTGRIRCRKRMVGKKSKGGQVVCGANCCCYPRLDSSSAELKRSEQGQRFYSFFVSRTGWVGRGGGDDRQGGRRCYGTQQ
jgi:hypothetical protein